MEEQAWCGASACAVQALGDPEDKANDCVEAEQVEDVVLAVVKGDLAIQAIAGAGGLRVLWIWSASIMLYFSLSSGGMTFL